LRHLLIDREGRLRTAWRLLAFGALFIIFQAVAVLLVIPFTGDPRGVLGRSLSAPEQAAFLVQAISFVGTTITVFLARRWLDHRTLVSLGLTPGGSWLREILLGALLGIGLQAGIFATELALGWLRVDQVGWRGASTIVPGLIAMLLVFLAVAWNEELLTRGYLLQNLEEGLGIVPAVIVSSVIFGLLHIFNANSSVLASLGVAIAGLLLAAAYLVRRTLWLPIGLHLGWNFGEGPIFGFPVSGLDAGGLFTLSVTGPEEFTGGAFGPEAGILAIAAEIIGIGLLLIWYRRHQRQTWKTEHVPIAESSGCEAPQAESS
jgi:membrane protease YdiL (CAAX protease family)